MTVTPRTAAAHVFVDDIAAPELADEDGHHLGRARRLRPGEAITVSDGRGRWRAAAFGSPLEALGPIHEVGPPTPPITIVLSPTKGDRPDWAVQKLTEVGVDRIVALRTERAVVRWEGPRAERQLDRWRRIAREAAGQSRRVWLPEIGPVVTFADVAGWPGVCLAQPGGAHPDLRHPVVAIGPEGGWSESELTTGLPTVDLGPYVQRSETAAVVAAALLVSQRSEGAEMWYEDGA